MKKINLILCACAVALAGLMVSCKNNNVDIINVTNTKTNYIYKVSGTVTSTSNYGATATSVTNTVTTYTIKDAYTGKLTEEVDEQMERNNTYYDISLFGGSVSATKTVTDAAGSKTETVKDVLSVSSLGSLSFYDIDGDYYIVENWAFVNVDDAFDGFVGDDEFTFKYTTAVSNGQMTQTQKDAGMVSNGSTSYDLTFTLVGEE